MMNRDGDEETMDSQLKVRRTCRGSGKIFSLIEYVGTGIPCALEACSVLSNGTVVPSKVHVYEQNASWVLVLAVLDVSQTVELRCVDADGHELVRVKRVVHPKVAKMSSQVHTFMKDALTERIRNYDIRPCFDEYGVEVKRLIQAPNDVDVLQVEAVCVSDSLEALSAPVSVSLMDRKGKRASIGDCVMMRDSTEAVPGTTDCFRRMVQFSIRTTSSLDAAIIWILTENEKTQSGFVGFLALEPHDLVFWRNYWHGTTWPAFLEEAYTEQYHRAWELPKRDWEIQRHTQLRVNPMFSIIVPLYRTPLGYFDEMVESVLGQSYGNFELILVNASPEDNALCKRVEHWHNYDSRVKTVNLAQNYGITENTNEGIKAATGDFLCFLDHDDTLTLDALFCYAKALEDYPETDMFYSDEDHVEEGVYKNPYFKPDWEPDLLLGMNYVCHFLAVRKSIVDGMELPTKEFDGSQDHHMALRVSEVARNIYHCRKVLYHWRIHPGSTANNTGEKPYAVEAGRLAVQAHLDRTDAHARAVHSMRAEGRYEVEYELTDHPLVSILIPNKDAVPVLERCLRSIREKTDYDAYEVVVIENNSEDESTFAFYERARKEDPHVRVVYYEGGFNYAKINNFGAAQARGEYLLLLNNDTEVLESGWLTRMVSLCMRPTTGIVGAKLLYPDGTVQHAGVISNQYGGPGHVNMYMDGEDAGTVETLRLMQDVTAVTGACLMTSRKVFTEVGGMDPIFEVDYNDVDFCWRVRKAGYLVVFDPSVRLYHYESVSRGFHPSPASALRFEREKGLLRQRWPERYAFADPMGNPNYSQGSPYYRLGSPAQ